MPKDRITQAHQGYGFVEFMGEEDADYAIKIMNMIKVYGKPIRVNKVLPSLFSVLHRSLFDSSFRILTDCMTFRLSKLLPDHMMVKGAPSSNSKRKSH